MEAGEEPGASELPDIAQNLKLIDIKNISGSAKALWKSVKKSKSYLVYLAVENSVATIPVPPTTPSPGPGGTAALLSALPTPPEQPGTSGYNLYDVCTASRITISGLTAGKRIWVVVLVVGAGGKSGFSDPATIIVR
jgi:hypothetical protein